MMNKCPECGKKISIVAMAAIVAIIGITIYNIKIAPPRKLEAQNEATYEEAIELLEKGKYDDGNKILQTITGYKDVDTILEQIKWESRVYECITNFKNCLNNSDSLQVYDVFFYGWHKSDMDETKESLAKMAGDEPICVMHKGGQNGFGGNTIGYLLFLYSNGAYQYMGSCDSLDMDKIDDNDKEEVAICDIINSYKDNFEQVGDVDLARIETIIENDSYSTINIIE